MRELILRSETVYPKALELVIHGKANLIFKFCNVWQCNPTNILLFYLFQLFYFAYFNFLLL